MTQNRDLQRWPWGLELLTEKGKLGWMSEAQIAAVVDDGRCVLDQGPLGMNELHSWVTVKVYSEWKNPVELELSSFG